MCFGLILAGASRVDTVLIEVHPEVFNAPSGYQPTLGVMKPNTAKQTRSSTSLGTSRRERRFWASYKRQEGLAEAGGSDSEKFRAQAYKASKVSVSRASTHFFAELRSILVQVRNQLAKQLGLSFAAQVGCWGFSLCHKTSF